MIFESKEEKEAFEFMQNIASEMTSRAGCNDLDDEQRQKFANLEVPIDDINPEQKRKVLYDFDVCYWLKLQTKERLMNDDNLCSEFFVMFLSGKQGFRNKTLGLMTDFFEGHWASRTSPNALKRGYNAERTFQEQDIIWFQAEMLKLIEQELNKDTTKLQEVFDKRGKQ